MPAGLKLVNLKRFPENSVVKWLGSIYKWLPPSAFQAKQTVLISYRCIWRGSLTQYPLGSPRKYDSSHDVLTHLILLIELHSSNGFICLDVLKRIGNKNQHMHQMVPWWWFTVVQVKKNHLEQIQIFRIVSWSQNHAPQQSTGCGSGTSGTNKTQSSDWIVIASKQWGASITRSGAMQMKWLTIWANSYS